MKLFVKLNELLGSSKRAKEFAQKIEKFGIRPDEMTISSAVRKDDDPRPMVWKFTGSDNRSYEVEKILKEKKSEAEKMGLNPRVSYLGDYPVISILDKKKED